ncbi:hypothetical protein AXF42_Ash005007 [Apostasia shenzhenica]|uniref:AB hydrolase-1 domain-containing protein n=1 Tax=Apostasia shenzhenica TaxID=1088818 RepID=A0A2I0B868_9ASPA|nr:hypothetical protein AXF42_Ash005007 [Apostasia shenzhenica]
MPSYAQTPAAQVAERTYRFTNFSRRNQQIPESQQTPFNREMGISLIPIIEAFARRAFSAAGLRQETIAVDHETSIRCWLPSSLPRSDTQNSIPKPNSSNPISNPPLLLIHGFGPAATWQWRSQVRSLARHFDLIVPELVFFGESTTRSPERSEKFQAAAMAALLSALGLQNDGVAAVVGTSYGGFVAYHLARILGEGRIGKVVIASSDLGKREEDDVKLMDRAGGVESVTDLMLPRSTASLRKLIRLAVRRPPPFMPEFVLRDVLRNLFKDNLELKMELLKGITLGQKDVFQLTPLPQETWRESKTGNIEEHRAHSSSGRSK